MHGDLEKTNLPESFLKKKKHTTDSSRTAFKKSGFQVNLISDEKLKMQIMKQEPATVF